MLSAEIRPVLVALALATVSGSSLAQLAISTGIDYTSGKYGSSEKTTDLTIPVVLRYDAGPLSLRLNVPYVRTTGTFSTGAGVNTRTVRERQSGLGDVTAFGAYTVYSQRSTGLGLDLGGKIKFATADKAKDLITTGENDYSLQAEVYRPFGGTTVFGTVGWTKMGDTAQTDFRNPLYGGFGLSNKLSDSTSWGLAYDWRERLTSGGDPRSEATLFLTHRYSNRVKVQGYLIGGFSDASPDYGGGAVMTYGF